MSYTSYECQKKTESYKEIYPYLWKSVISIIKEYDFIFGQSFSY